MQSFLHQLPQIPFPTETCRLFHGRGGLFAGAEHLCLDWFAPVLLLTSFKALTEAEINQLQQAIGQWSASHSSAPMNLIYQCREREHSETRLLQGEVPERHVITEHGCHYLVHLMRGQNHGLFLDMSEGRAWVQANAKHKRVLNLFAYTCGFSVAAMKGGADQVINMDMSKGALSIGKQNHQLNGMGAGVSFLGHDIFKSWGKLRKMAPYELLIIDPPSNQKGSFVATKDYVRLLRKLPELCAPNAEILLCLNAPELDTSFLKQQVVDAAPEFEFISRLANPSAFADIDEEKSLKVLRYRYQG